MSAHKYSNLYNLINSTSNIRVTYALCPDHGSDRQVGWSALESDVCNGREVLYITSRHDYNLILKHYSKDSRDVKIDIGSVSITYWDGSFIENHIKFGYVRYMLWVLSLQFFLNKLQFPRVKNLHFLTYTQLATPIILKPKYNCFHGPCGTTPFIPDLAGVSKAIFFKSQLTWRFIIPVLERSWAKCNVKRAVVHPNLANNLKNREELDVISALNVDYLASDINVYNEFVSSDGYDVICVGRDIAIKNFSIIKEVMNSLSNNDVRCLMVDSTLPENFEITYHNFTIVGRKKRQFISDLLSSSKLHIMLSMELGGYINLEAAAKGLPTLCLEGYGASEMLKPTSSFMLKNSEVNTKYITNKVVTLLADDDYLIKEGSLQKHNAISYVSCNKEKFEEWLELTASK